MTTYNTIEERTEELAALMAELWPEESEPKPKRQRPTISVDIDMTAIMEKMFASKNGAQIKALYDGDISGHHSQSEADLALMNEGAFWFDRNPDAMDAFMRGSGLYREKWERNDYRSDTIQKAIDGCKKTYQDGLRERQRGKPFQHETVSRHVAAKPQDQDNAEEERPVIKWNEAQIHVVIEQVQDILVDKWTRGETPVLYRRPEGVVRIGKVERASRASRFGVKRDTDGLMLYPVEAAWLHAYLGSIIDWQKYNLKTGWKSSSCPKQIVELFLAKRGELRIPFLTGIISAPTMRSDGTILDKPGYDDETGLFFAPGNIEWPKVPENPTWQDALSACAYLLDLLSEFPFKDDVSRSVALAYILTCLIRRILPRAPAFAGSATAQGTGKTYLFNAGSLIATGCDADLVAPPEDEAEMKKLLTALLIEGASVIVIDNVMRTFFSETLCAILTAETFKGRILGQSRTPRVSTNAVFAITGNNLTLRGDTVRRFLLCELDAQMERPEERPFKRDLESYIKAHRPEIVIAGLTMLRAHFLAANKPKLKPYGSFGEWSALVRSTIVWCSEPDPCESKSRIEADDPEREGLLAVLNAWRDAFGDKPATIKDALDPQVGGQELIDVLTSVTPTSNKMPLAKAVG